MAEFLGIEAEIPFAPAGGAINGPNVDSIIERTRAVLRSPLSISRWASATYNGGEGNEPKYGRVYYHNSLTGQTVNSLGLPSVDIATMVSVFPELEKEAEDRGKAIIPGISGAVGDQPQYVLPEMAARLVEAGAKRIEVNYSCPNKFDESGKLEATLSHDLETMEEVDDLIIERVGEDIWVVRKIAPLVGNKKALIPGTIDFFARRKGRVALSFNTVGGQIILTEDGEPALDVPGNVGGLSGPATKQIGRNMLRVFRANLPERVQIDSPLGVDDGAEVYERVDVMGANFSSGVTVYWENDNNKINFEQTGRRIADEYYVAKEAALEANGN